MEAGVSTTLEGVAAVLGAAKRILVLGHINIDADCLGSGLAIVGWARGCGKEARLCADSAIPSTCRFLPGTDGVVRYDPSMEVDLRSAGWDVVFLPDIPNPDRVERLVPFLKAFPGPVINLDHHVSNLRYGTHNLVEPAASSTGELVHDLFRSAGWSLTRDIATCLYAAIITDTGRFSYSNTTARTHLVVADLYAAGIDQQEVFRRFYQSHSLGEVRLRGLAFGHLQSAKRGEIAWTAVSRAMLEEAGALPEDAHDFAESCRAIEGVRVGLVFRETREPGRIKVSFRSDGSVDVNRLAGRFGGGGHVAAAGCFVSGTLDAVQQEVIAEVERGCALTGI